jgi:hypothetical protein
MTATKNILAFSLARTGGGPRDGAVRGRVQVQGAACHARPAAAPLARIAIPRRGHVPVLPWADGPRGIWGGVPCRPLAPRQPCARPHGWYRTTGTLRYELRITLRYVFQVLRIAYYWYATLRYVTYAEHRNNSLYFLIQILVSDPDQTAEPWSCQLPLCYSPSTLVCLVISTLNICPVKLSL